MKLIRTLLSSPDVFKNKMSSILYDEMNEKEIKCLDIVEENKNLRDDVLEDKIAKELYGASRSDSNYKTFRKGLKRKIRKIIDLCEYKFSDIGNIYIEIERDRSRIMQLLIRGYREAAHEDSRSLLRKAVKYHYYEAARSISLMIVQHYNKLNYGSSSQFERYLAVYRKMDAICLFESTIEMMYSNVVKVYYKGSERSVPVEMAERISGELDVIISKVNYDSFYLMYKYYSMRLMTCKSQEYNRWCEEALEYYSGLPFKHTSHICIFNEWYLKRKIEEGSLVKCKLLANALISDVKKYSLNWYLFNHTLVKVLLHLGEVKKARQVYEDVISSDKYKILPGQNKGEWGVLGMYVYLLNSDISKISLHKTKWHINCNTHVGYLVGEVIYNFLSGKGASDRTDSILKNIKRLSKPRSRERMVYHYFKSFRKFENKDVNLSGEYAPYGKLLDLVKA